MTYETENPVIIAEQPEADKWWKVAAYLIELRYGGPEEGGWWYRAGDRVTIEGFEEIQTFHNEEAAQEYLEKLAAVCGKMNERRPKLSSVNSNGCYFAIRFERKCPPSYYSEHSHYE